MSDPTPSTPVAQPPPKRRRWLKRLILATGFFLLLLVVLFFVATSSAFIKSVVLPRAGKSLNAEITAGSISVSPFSRLQVKNLTVKTRGAVPLLQASDVDAHYSLWQIMKGNIAVQKVFVSGATVTLIEDPDGDTNLDPILKAMQSSDKDKKKKKSDSDEPLKLDIQEVRLENMTFRQIKQHRGGGQDLLEIKQPQLLLTDLKNGGSGKASLISSLRIDNQPPAPAPPATLDASIKGDFTFQLAANLLPSSLQGKTTMKVGKASGSLQELQNLEADLISEITPAEIKQLSLSFKRGTTDLGQLIAQGPLDLVKKEGTLSVQFKNINKEVLNLAAASSGIDFGSTLLTSTNQVIISNGGANISAAGTMNANQVTITRNGQTTPQLDSRFQYEVAIDQKAGNALLKKFTLSSQQDREVFLEGTLNQPMAFSWGTTSQSVGDSDLKFTIRQFDLADWKAFLGTVAPAGLVDGTLHLVSQKAGKQLHLDLKSDVKNLTLLAGSNRLDQLTGTISVQGDATEMQSIQLSQMSLLVSQKGKELATVNAQGNIQLSNKVADVQVKLNSSLPAVVAALSLTNMASSQGQLDLDGRIKQTGQERSLVGKLAIRDFTGKFGGNSFTRFAVTSDMDVLLQSQDLQVKKLTGQFSENGQAGGSFDLKAKYNLGQEKGEADLKIDKLNENGLRPFIAAALGDKELVSVLINGTTTLRYDVQGESSIKSDLDITKLVVKDPANKLPQTPLETQIKLDGTLKDQAVEIKQAMLSLTPTKRAKNQLTITGKFSLDPSNNLPASVVVQSDSLDVTPYYQLFAKPNEKTGGTKPVERSSTPPPGAISSAKPAEEPGPITLPVRQGKFDMQIGALYLEELAITNLNTTAQINQGKLNLHPLQMHVNGKPVTGNIQADLSVPGYVYDIKLTADHLPIAPFVNTFMPEDKGRYVGDIVLNADVKGRGVTGQNLQKNLSGKMDFVFTNANIQITGPKFRAFFTPIAALLRTPELLESPITWMTANTTMGNGSIVMTNLHMLSATFTAQTSGNIPIRPELMDSPITKWPMTFSLRKSLAEKARLVSKESKEEYVKLPNFIRVAGTVGAPKPELDTKALAGGLLERFGTKIPGLDENTGKLLENLGGVISGDKGTNTDGSKKEIPLEGVLDLFNKKDKKKN